MKRYFLVLAALITLASPAVCAATPPRLGPYVSGFLGISVPQNADVAGVDYLEVPPLAFNERVEFDPSINVGGTAGYDFGIIRLEGEISYKHGELASITDQIGGQRFSNADGSLGALAMMFNAFFDLHNPSPITPYWGGGVGFAAMHLSDTFVNNVLFYQEDDDAVFAYQVGAGLEIALNHMLSLDLGYRYFGTTKANFGRNLDIATDLELQSHNVAIGFRVKY
jgi:opacity protein-like surface antigen